MSPKREKFYRTLFLIATVYDISLGIIFTFFYRAPFKILGIANKMPASGAYLSLIGAFLFVIGIAYYLIYRGDLLKNRDLVTVGTLYKLAYCLVAFYYAVVGDIPHLIFVLLFGSCDFIFFILMLECRLYLHKITKQA
jgi:formate/nitrite transporter FocA (FNT family)